MPGQLEGKVAVITGGASGIGRGTVGVFAEEGAKVIAADIQDGKGPAIEKAYPGKVRYVHCDVTKEEDIAHTIEIANAEFGRLDCVFNNAGSAASLEDVDKVTPAGFDQTMHLLVLPALLAIKYAVPIMKSQGGGSIISTSSICGIQAGWGPPLYSMAKAQLIHLTRVAALMLAPHSVRVNCICPGYIAAQSIGVGMGLSIEEADASLEKVAAVSKDFQPIPRAGRPVDIANGAVFLASDASTFITGQALAIDGGITLGSLDCSASLVEPIAKALGLGSDVLENLSMKR